MKRTKTIALVLLGSALSGCAPDDTPAQDGDLAYRDRYASYQDCVADWDTEQCDRGRAPGHDLDVWYGPYLSGRSYPDRAPRADALVPERLTSATVARANLGGGWSSSGSGSSVTRGGFGGGGGEGGGE